MIVANGDEGDPGSYIDKLLMEDNPHLLLEGMALAGYAVGADHGFILVRSRVPALQARARRSAIARGARGDGHLGERFDVTVVEGAGSYVVGEETALLSCLQGLRGTVSARPPFPAERGVHGLPTVVNNVETLCNIPFIAAPRRRRLPRAQPRTRRPGTKLVCFNERFARPGAYEVPFGMTVRELCEDVAGGMRERPRDQGAADRRPARRHPARARMLDTVFDFEPLAGRGLHGRPRRDRRLRRAHRHARGRQAPAALRRRRELRQVLPVPDRPAARARDVRRRRAGRPREASRQLLEALELGSLCAHGGGMPAPIRSLLAHFPEELGLA